jgi:hypothetical protein
LAVIALAACQAKADSSLLTFLEAGTPMADLRARFEAVDDKSKTVNARAYTLRTRLGYETASWNGLNVLAELDQIWDVGGPFNSTRNGRILYPTVADPAMTALNRLQLTYKSAFDTKFVIGRQRILLADQRFVGNAGWRQHEQTFDAVTVTNESVPHLSLSYSYVDRVNRVYGSASPWPSSGPAGAFHCDCHILDAVYSGVPSLKLEAFGLLLALDQRHGPLNAMIATSKLSTATIGLRADEQIVIGDDLTAKALVAYAHQTGYRNNPVRVDLGYWRGEASLDYAGLAVTVGYESMQGNGTLGFSTPLATTHAFDGWADLFLTTPANGLDNLYFKGSYAAKSVASLLHIDAVTATLVHRDFSADRTGIGIGSEWYGALELGVDRHASVLLQYANYQGSGLGLGGFRDKSIGWVQLTYKE